MIPYPLIHFFITECLSRMILCVEHNNRVHGIKVARNATPISHILYANEVVIFLLANLNEGHNLKLILDNYCLWHRQTINLQKSILFFFQKCFLFVEGWFESLPANFFKRWTYYLFGSFFSDWKEEDMGILRFDQYLKR